MVVANLIQLSRGAIDDAVLAGEEIIEAIVVAKTKKKAAKKVKKD